MSNLRVCRQETDLHSVSACHSPTMCNILGSFFWRVIFSFGAMFHSLSHLILINILKWEFAFPLCLSLDGLCLSKIMQIAPGSGSRTLFITIMLNATYPGPLSAGNHCCHCLVAELCLTQQTGTSQKPYTISTHQGASLWQHGGNWDYLSCCPM